MSVTVRIVRAPRGMLMELFEDTVQFWRSTNLGKSCCSKTEESRPIARPAMNMNTGDDSACISTSDVEELSEIHNCDKELSGRLIVNFQ